MKYRFIFTLLASLLLAACGRGGEDFAFKVQRPADKVRTAFQGISINSEMSTMFPGLKAVRTEPTPDEVLYTIPGDGAFEATIKLTFEPIEDGKATKLHAAIDVPKTEVTFEGKSMVISETKVEFMLAELLRKAGKKLEAGDDIAAERSGFAQVLAIIGIVTDSKKLRLAQEMTQYPEWYMAGLGWLIDGGDGPAGAYGDSTMPDDPNAAARQDEYRQKDAEREAQSKAEDAARPMDDAQGDSGGDY